MNLNSARSQIRAVVFGIFGIIIAIVFIRILLRLVGANPNAGFVVFWYDLSGFFVSLFRDMYPTLQETLLKVRIELFSVVALLFYVIVAFLFQKSLISVTAGDTVEIVKDIIDSMFKIAEFLLISRFVFKLTGASTISGFVDFIYSISAIVNEPFRGILPTININNYNIIFESSTLIAIVVIIVFDLVTEGIIDNLTRSAPKRQLTPRPVPAPIVAQPLQPVPAQPQNITINVPQQPQPPQYVDRRQVHIVQPKQPTYPQAKASHLEGQRPQPQQQLPGQRRLQPDPNRNAPRNPNTGGGWSAR